MKYDHTGMEAKWQKQWELQDSVQLPEKNFRRHLQRHYNLVNLWLSIVRLIRMRRCGQWLHREQRSAKCLQKKT